jgi:hypothetical protein
LQAFTGYTGSGDITVASTSVAQDWQDGYLVALCTTNTPSQDIVADHCYALINYSPTMGFEMFNPWGLKGTLNSYPSGDQSKGDLVWESPTQLVADFSAVNGAVVWSAPQQGPGTTTGLFGPASSVGAADFAFQSYAGIALGQGEAKNNLAQPNGTSATHQPALADDGAVTPATILDASKDLHRAHEAALDEIFQSGDPILSADDVVFTYGRPLSLQEHGNSSR